MGMWDNVKNSTQDKDVRSALVQAGLTNLGSSLAGAGAQQQTQYNAANDARSSARANRQQALNNALAQKQNAFAGKRAEEDAGDRLAASMLGPSPLAFQNERASAARKQELFKGIDNGALGHLGVHAGPFGGGTNFATNFGPSAEAEQPYWDTVARISRGRASSPNLEAIYGKSGKAVDDTVAESGSGRWNEWAKEWDVFQNQQDQGYANLVAQAEKDISEAKTEMEKATKTSWWQKVLGIVGTVAPMVLGLGGFGGAGQALGGAVPGGTGTAMPD